MLTLIYPFYVYFSRQVFFLQNMDMNDDGKRLTLKELLKHNKQINDGETAGNIRK